MPTTLLRVSSRQHPLIQECRRLARQRHDDHLLLDGAHLVDEALRSPDRVRLQTVIVLADRADSAEFAPLLDRAQSAGAAIYAATASAIDAASPVRSTAGLVAIARWTPASAEEALATSPALALALVDVQDPGNVGAVIRCADALGGTGVVACGQTADPGGWKALRGAMGSTFRLPVARADASSLIALARRRGLALIATVNTDGVALGDCDLVRPALILLGHEGAGLSATLVDAADARVTIPMRAGVNSLNVGVTAALVLFEAGRQRAYGRRPSRS